MEREEEEGRDGGRGRRTIGHIIHESDLRTNFICLFL